MPKRLAITSLQEVSDLENKIVASAKSTIDSLSDLLRCSGGVVALYALKFGQKGVDPIEGTPLNFIEQLNQTFTYLTSLRGVAFLFKQHPTVHSFRLNLGVARGPDIVSGDGSIVAETFASVKPTNNNKLQKDIQRVAVYDAPHKYVLFHCPNIKPGPYPHQYGFPEVKVRCLALPLLQEHGGDYEQ